MSNIKFEPTTIAYSTKDKVPKGVLKTHLRESDGQGVNLNIHLHTRGSTSLALKSKEILSAHLGDDIEAAKPLAEAILKEIIEWMNR